MLSNENPALMGPRRLTLTAYEYAHVVNNTVLVDRRTRWGNPWRVGRDGTRTEVIARYRADLWRRIRSGEIALEELAALDGCWLACW